MAGFSPTEFWEQTPREYAALLRGYGQRVQVALEQAVTAGWVAALQNRAQKPETDLARLLAQFRPRAAAQPQTAEDLRATMRLWVAATGGHFAHETPNDGD